MVGICCELTASTCLCRETLRLYPGVPMFIPQEAVQDIQVGPWQIPKGSLTMSYPFISQRDGKVHENPDM